jgi:glycerophosphoryl diester phosphodiesterase
VKTLDANKAKPRTESGTLVQGRPFFAYVTTYTTHSPHDQGQMDFQKKSNNRDIKPYDGPITFTDSTESEITLRAYLGFLQYEDAALKSLMDDLKQKDMLKNTIVLLYNDHRYYGFNQDSAANFYQYNELPMAMILPDGQLGELASMGSHLDVAPTLLNLVEGANYQERPQFLGQSWFGSYQPQVLNKCLGNVFYANENSIVRGNVKTGLVDYVKNLVKDSDAVLAADQLLAAEETTLASTDAKIIQKRLVDEPTALKVAVGLGSINGIAASNTLDALNKNYDAGFRYFETDLMLTKDNQIALSNDLAVHEMNLADFEKLKYQDRYTTLSWFKLLDWLNNHPEANIIIDSRENFQSLYSLINIDWYLVTHSALFNRLIPQIYQPNDLNFLKIKNQFANIVFNGRVVDWSESQWEDYIIKNPAVSGVLIQNENSELAPFLKENKVLMYLDAVNEQPIISALNQKGIGVFTDTEK